MPDSLARRLAVRETWMHAAPPGVVVRFLLSQEEASDAMRREAERYGDLVFVRGGYGTGYRSIVYKTFALVEWVVNSGMDPKFVLKTDDDAYVDTSALVKALRAECENPDCANEKLYFGEEKKHGEVIVEEGNKWSNKEYYQLTGMKEYVPYMYGGGYVFSGDVARALAAVNSLAALKFMPNEDATFGFWVMGMNLRRVDSPRVKTAAGQCCFSALDEAAASGAWHRFQIRTNEALCDGWLILHKVEGPDQMRYLHHRLRDCPEQRGLLEAAAALAPQPQPLAVAMTPLQPFALTDYRRGYHFFGQGEAGPWSADGRLMLALRTALTPENSNPGPGHEAIIGLIRFAEGRPGTQSRPNWNWEDIETCRGWNFVEGCRLQWLPGSSSRALFNDDRCPGPLPPGSELCAVELDVLQRRRVRTLPRPVYSLSPDGTLAASISMRRLQRLAPGMGRAPPPPPGSEAVALAAHPPGDGLWVMRTDTGRAQLIVNLERLHKETAEGRFSKTVDPVTQLEYGTGALAAYLTPRTLFAREPELAYISAPPARGASCKAWLARPHWALDGRSLAFLYHLGHCHDSRGRHDHRWDRRYLFTVSVDGGGLWRVPLVAGSQHDWGPGGRLLVCDAGGVYLVRPRKSVRRLVKPPALAGDGDTSCRFYRSNPRWIVGATAREPSKLWAWDVRQGEALTVGVFGQHQWPGPGWAKGGLAPHWSPDGRFLAMDSAYVWDTGLQMYVLGVQLLQAGLRAGARALPGALANSSTALTLAQPADDLAAAAGELRGSLAEEAGDEGASGTASSAAAMAAAEAHTAGGGGRRLFIELALRSGEGVMAFLAAQGGAAASWQVHAFEAPAPGTEAAGALAETIARVRTAAQSVHLYPIAAGLRNESVTVNTLGLSRYDVSMTDLSDLVFGKNAERQAGQQKSWWARHFGGCEAWHACSADPVTDQARNIASQGAEVPVEALDLNEWLAANVRTSDYVAMHLDLEGTRQFSLLRHLLRGGTLRLINRLLIKWHFQFSNWHWTLVWEHILAVLGIQFDVLRS